MTFNSRLRAALKKSHVSINIYAMLNNSSFFAWNKHKLIRTENVENG